MPILFFLLWLLLAGNVTVGVCLWGGAVSILLDLFCRKMLGYRPQLGRNAAKKLWKGCAYLVVLVWEMLKAGFVVMKLVYTRGRSMHPKLIWFDTTLHTDWGRAALADSITLTAGTITVETSDGRMCVHALNASLAEGIERCDFQRRLEELEA